MITHSILTIKKMYLNNIQLLKCYHTINKDAIIFLFILYFFYTHFGIPFVFFL